MGFTTEQVYLSRSLSLILSQTTILAKNYSRFVIFF